MKDTLISWVSRVDSKKTKTISLENALEEIQSGKYEDQVERVRAAFKQGGKKEAAIPKKKLPAILFSGRFSERNDEGIQQHSGILVADLDELECPIPELRNKLKQDRHVLFCFVSPTGSGLKVGFKVPADADRHADSFAAIAAYVKQEYDEDIDQSCKNLSRLCFTSHDPDLYVNWEAEPLSTEWAKQEVAQNGNPRGIVVGAERAGDEEREEVTPTNLRKRKQAIKEMFPDVEWVADDIGQLECPGIHHHTNGDGERDCQIFLGAKGDIPPCMHCFHDSCKAEVSKASERIWVALAPHSKEAYAKLLEHLASMPSVEYDHVRKDEAKRLDIRTATLDKEVKGKRKEAGKPNPFDDGLDPWPEPVQTAELLNDLVVTSARFVYAPDHHLHTLACVVLHTWAIDAFDMTVRVMIQSPEYACGKSVILNLLKKLARNPFKSENVTQAVLYHIIHKHGPTVLLDEVDSLSPEQRDAMVNVLNAGNSREAQVWRVEGEGGERDARCYNCFAPIVVAGIGRRKFPPATVSRAIVLRMTRKPQEHKTERPRNYDSTELRRKCRRWAMDHTGHLQDCQPELPEELSDRQQDVWESLFIIAEKAGGEWPTLIREAALKLHNISADEIESTGNELLRHIKIIFEEGGEDRIHTKKLLEKLNDLDEAGYGGWNNGQGMKAKDLNKKLAEYEIKSRRLRIGDDNLVGFTGDQFAVAWDTYLPAPVPCSITIGGAGAQEIERHEPPGKNANTPEEAVFETIL